MKPGRKAQAERERGGVPGFTPAELADYLGVSKRSIRRWQQARLIPEPGKTESGWAVWSLQQAREIREWRLSRIPPERR
jgi:DNA-binding transcriptional MerR regulator